MNTKTTIKDVKFLLTSRIKQNLQMTLKTKRLEFDNNTSAKLIKPTKSDVDLANLD